MNLSPASTPPAFDAAALESRVAARVRSAGSSFFWGMRVVPGAQRRAIYAVYAFCREIDDLADSAEPSARRLERLALWRAEIEALYQGRPNHWIGQALLPAVRAFALEQASFHAILDGVERDAAESMVAPEDALLRRYCGEVAGAVGLLTLQILAEEDPDFPETWRRLLAASMGEALQLTNILRDVAEDAARGRLYLPRELLLAERLPLTPSPTLMEAPGLTRVLATLGARACTQYRQAEDLLDQVPRRRLRACRIMLATYRALLDRLEARGWPVTGPRVRLRPAERLALLLRHGLI